VNVLTFLSVAILCEVAFYSPTDSSPGLPEHRRKAATLQVLQRSTRRVACVSRLIICIFIKKWY
ncbi:hypothetical protein, partial [Nostoc sp. NOS(2021)]|uniref:hypothetical protein n=1 Tax=Nostoc sp. NOS(2021) TaxID=2815407 RepID=UPI0025D50BAA